MAVDPHGDLEQSTSSISSAHDLDSSHASPSITTSTSAQSAGAQALATPGPSTRAASQQTPEENERALEELRSLLNRARKAAVQEVFVAKYLSRYPAMYRPLFEALSKIISIGHDIGL